MRNQTVGLAVHVNGHEYVGELEIDHDTQVLWSDSPRPDPKWTFTDAQGHFHAYAKGFPTLDMEMVHVDCDGSCGGTCGGEGFHETHYYCRICREEITPGTIAGPHQSTVSGPTSWTVRVKGEGRPSLLLDESVSVRIVDSEGALFGVARVANKNIWSMGDVGGFEVELVGEGPLKRQGESA